MCLINVSELSRKKYVTEDENCCMEKGHVEIVGKLNCRNGTGLKLVKKMNIFYNNSASQNIQNEIIENLVEIASYYRKNANNSAPPLYESLSNSTENKQEKCQRDIEQLILNTLLLYTKQKQYIIDKIYYNCFNNLDNPAQNSYCDKKINVSMGLEKDSIANKPQSITNHSENKLSNYNRRRSSIVSSVINDLDANNYILGHTNNESLKEFMTEHDTNISTTNSNESSVFSISGDSTNGLTENNYAPTLITESSSSCRNTDKSIYFLNSKPTNKLSYFNSIDEELDFNFQPKKLNIQYEKALNTDPRVIVLPSVMCKSPSEDSQRHRDIRRLLSAEMNADQINEPRDNHPEFDYNSSECESEDDSISDSNGLLRVNSRFVENSPRSEEQNLVLTGKDFLLRGFVNIKNNSKLPCLLCNNVKIMLCGYKLSYDHCVLNSSVDSSQIFENLSVITESVNGLRVTKPFIKKEVNLLKDQDYCIILDEKTLKFEILIDSREFPSTLNCKYGKIEYRLECYINAVNISNVILNEKIVIIKSLEPSMSNLINQNDSILKQNNPLTVYNKFLEHSQWKVRHKYFDFDKEPLSQLIDEDEYLDGSHWERLALKYPNLVIPDSTIKCLSESKILYDVFLPSKTIVFNEPFEFYFKIALTPQCVNDWNIIDCTLCLEQHYCFPYTTKLNKKGERYKTDRMKYKKVFLYPLLTQKHSIHDKVKSVCFSDAVVKSDLAIYDSVFKDSKDVDITDTLDKIVPHYDELNTLYPDSNKIIKNIINVSHKLKINFTVECLPTSLNKHRLKKQFSMSLPVFLITSYTLSTMTLPTYEK